ncbi:MULTISPECIES: sensor histidine kinase [Clostridia]|uniref:sensor histidine kinase n=1 Tax=Clostridia TaxID=186801 RepID=UPI000EA2BE30|nr:MULTISPECIES: sensor histidine kinase [Clostridia]NBJ71431.1 sensor histidine kinase [Roseburia sp. 1XD42-34]RKI74571.1 sensor histidine kinase [Clostridium sp. 1xD42-85]
MKDFLKDSIPTVLFFYAQLLVFIFIVQLFYGIKSVPMGWDLITYLFILLTFGLLLFLAYRYYRLRDYYVTIHQDKENVTWLPDPPTQLLTNIKQQHDTQTSRYAEEIERLKQQKQMEFHFIQQWVHQMKTPVSVMHLTLQKEKLQLPQGFLHNMHEELERMQQGLDLALYQSRLQKFDRDFQVQQIELRALVKEVIQEFKSSFIRNQVYPELVIPQNYIVTTDSKWLRFVINQAVSNAIKYSKPESAKIYFRTKVFDHKLTLQITDTGYGIPREDINRVFDPFFTGKNGRKFRESTGMGLYLSKQVCIELGHELTISSEEGKGTTVSIHFQQH